MNQTDCPWCGFGGVVTSKGKIRRHNKGAMKYDRCGASGMTVDEYRAMYAADSEANATVDEAIARGEPPF